MANMQDRTMGMLLLLISTTVFSYYTLWALLMPFVDEGHVLHAYFPPREYAVKAPALVLVVAGMVAFGFIGVVMVRSGGRRVAAKGKVE